MSGMSQGARTGPRDYVVFAIILIFIGICGLVLQAVEGTEAGGGVVVLVLGLGLLGAFAYTRQYGYLIPGGILTGLGAGIVVSEAAALTDEGTGGVIVLGLGLGFVSIWVIGALVQLAHSHWWPLVPGAILSIVGGALLIGGQAVELLDYWWVLLIALGLLLLWRGWVEGHPRT